MPRINAKKSVLVAALTLWICAVLGEPASALTLSEAEKAHLQQKKAVTMCIDPDWMPYERINKQGRHEGMSADYMALFEQRIGVPIKLVPTDSWSESMDFARQRRCDILSLLNQSAERSQFLNFTAPYVEAPIVLVTRDDVHYLEGLKSLGERTLSTPKDYIYEERVRKDYPNINLVLVPTVYEGLKRVSKGEVFAHLGSIYVLVNEMQKHQLSNLKISGDTEYDLKLAIGVRKDDVVLLAIMDKAVRSISEAEHIKIRRKWTATKYEHGTDYSLIKKIVAAGLILVGAVLLWNWKQSRLYAKIKANETALRGSEERIRLILEAAGEGIYGLDLNGNTTFVNPAAAKMTGWTAEELAGKSQHQLIHHTKPDGSAYPRDQCPIYAAFNDGKVHIVDDEVFWRKDGSSFPVKYTSAPIMRAGIPSGAVVVFSDITEKKRAEDKIKHLASHDPLTNLPNRILLMDRLRQALARAHRNKKGAAVMFIDLDEFKPINDKYGHKSGDDVLKLVAERLSDGLRETDTVARVGGDEFTVILTDVADRRFARQMAEKLIAAVSVPLPVDGDEVVIGASVGISLYPQHSHDAEELLTLADRAMYVAKGKGKGQCQFTP